MKLMGSSKVSDGLTQPEHWGRKTAGIRALFETAQGIGLPENAVTRPKLGINKSDTMQMKQAARDFNGMVNFRATERAACVV